MHNLVALCLYFLILCIFIDFFFGKRDDVNVSCVRFFQERAQCSEQLNSCKTNKKKSYSVTVSRQLDQKAKTVNSAPSIVNSDTEGVCGFGHS